MSDPVPAAEQSATAANVYRVLFVCIGNSCRSPMAEAISRTRHAGVVEAASAGVAPASIVQPQTRQVLEEKGFELPPDKRPQHLKDSDWRSMDVIVNMSGAGILPFIPGFEGGSLIWEIADPMGQPISAYRKARDLIERHVNKLAEMLERHRAGS